MSDPLDLRGQLIRDMRYAATPAQLQAAKEAAGELIPIDLAAAVVMGHITILRRELHRCNERLDRAAITASLHRDLR